jgi:para-aminobenzoate synthetase component I
MHQSGFIEDKRVSDFLENRYFFLLENPKSLNQKSIYGEGLIEVFSDWNNFNYFLEYESVKLPSGAGFAGYISYEGDFEFAAYKKIKIENSYMKTIHNHPTPSARRRKTFIREPDKKEFLEAVEICKKHIEEGDIYQANLSRKYLIELQDCLDFEFAFDLYEGLKAKNPNPYQAFMDFANYLIISSSPESFLKIDFKEETNSYNLSISPIKGTSSDKDQLINSTKDMAEHIMIVDLERNDLGRISKTATVKTSELASIKAFPGLFHMVSTVQSELSGRYQYPFLNLEAIFKSCFPCGSITGAPKIRSMEIIRDLEKSPRGPFTGSLGYFIFQQGGEFNVLIRSLIFDKRRNEFSLSVGAGITAYSDSHKEFEETELKAEKILKIFRD